MTISFDTSPPNAALARSGQIQGTGGSWGSTTDLDGWRTLFLKLGSTEVLDAFLRNCVFKGKTRERNIRGGKSVAFPITGRMEATYHQPGRPILGQTNEPSALNERVIELDELMISDIAISQLDELMNYYDVRQYYTKELGRALAYEYDRRVARLVFAAAQNTTEPLNKTVNEGRIGFNRDLGTEYTDAAATNQEKGDELVEAIFDCRVNFEEKDVPTDNMYGVFTPEDYFLISQSSRAINTDFNGANGSNGTIAAGETLRVAGIPIYMSNHVNQPAYTLQNGDKNGDYAQDLSDCRGLIFHRDAVGVVSLLSPSLQMTGPEFRVQFQADLLVARQAIGMGQLRAECAASIVTP